MGKGVFIICVLLIAIPAALAQDIVVANTRDWQDLYLTSIYAKHIDASYMSFANLASAQLQTQTIREGTRVIVFESRTRPVVKNYRAVLDVNGFSGYEIVLFDEFVDLQSSLWRDVDTQGIAVLDARFGVEAIALSPFIINERYAVMFLSQDSYAQVRRDLRREGGIVMGRMPIRLLEGLEGEFFTQDVDANVREATARSIGVASRPWGIITRIDRIDLATITQGLPLFVYYGDVGLTSELVRSSELVNFEVIGGDMADIAKDMESRSGRKLNMLLKYARTITNVPGYEGRILDLETVQIPYPATLMRIDSVTHYPEMSRILVSYENLGNVPALFLSNIEFAGNPLADAHLHAIPAQSKVTIPYEYDVLLEEPSVAIINTRYGMRQPLSRSIQDPVTNQPLVRAAVVEGEGAERFPLSASKVEYDDARGKLYITLDSRQDLFVRAELILEDEVLSSEQVLIDARGIVVIDTPYHRAQDILGEREISLFYGTTDAFQSVTSTYTIAERSGIYRLAGAVVAVLTSTAGIIASAFIILLIILAVFITRRMRNE